MAQLFIAMFEGAIISDYFQVVGGLMDPSVNCMQVVGGRGGVDGAAIKRLINSTCRFQGGFKQWRHLGSNPAFPFKWIPVAFQIAFK